MLSQIEIKYSEYTHKVNLVLYPGFFPARVRDFRTIGRMLRHLPEEKAREVAADIALHIKDYAADPYANPKIASRQWKNWMRYMLPYMGGDWEEYKHGTTQGV